MNILYVTSEASPFCASGGLGDVLGSLPHAVQNLRENIVCEVILPLYKSISKFYQDKMKKVMDISFYLSWRETGASIYNYHYNGIYYYFVQNHYYFDRESHYGEYDDGERFAFFSKAVIEFLLKRGNIPDLLHANDWQSALSIIYLKTHYKSKIDLSNIQTVFTIHNIEYQGKFCPSIFEDVLDLNNAFHHILEWEYSINLLKGALLTSDYVTTVSKTYAYELRDDATSFGLSYIIQHIQSKFSGIVNGIDYTVFSSENDNVIFRSYGVEDRMEGKAYNKNKLQKYLGLDERNNVPLIAIITRLTEAKGMDLVLEAFDDLMKEDIQLILLGSGDSKYENAFTLLSRRYDNFKSIIRFDRELSKKIYAGADFFLMPSKSEPCGLAQMIACSYGTVPIVRGVGGLSDTINHLKNGFVFKEYNSHQMLAIIRKAINVYKDKESFDTLANNAKMSDFSWKQSAKEYLNLYDNLING